MLYLYRQILSLTSYYENVRDMLLNMEDTCDRIRSPDKLLIRIDKEIRDTKLIRGKTSDYDIYELFKTNNLQCIFHVMEIEEFSKMMYLELAEILSPSISVKDTLLLLGKNNETTHKDANDMGAGISRLKSVTIAHSFFIYKKYNIPIFKFYVSGGGNIEMNELLSKEITVLANLNIITRMSRFHLTLIRKVYSHITHESGYLPEYGKSAMIPVLMANVDLHRRLERMLVSGKIPPATKQEILNKYSITKDIVR
jgi:hypothetical protein